MEFSLNIIDAVCAIESKLELVAGTENWAYPQYVKGTSASGKINGHAVTVMIDAKDKARYIIDGKYMPFGRALKVLGAVI